MAGYFDSSIISWVTHYASKSWIIDYSMYCISDNNLLKGGLFLTMLWGFWFRNSGDQTRTRTFVLSTLAGSLLAIAINQTLLILTPMRIRPYVAGVPGVHFPFDLGLATRNSFPSDHAALFFALATGFWFISRRAAIATYLYTVVVICIPRICLGLHYPSDLLAGGFIGLTSVCLASVTQIRDLIARPLLAWEKKYPGAFYAVFFLFSYQLATLFDDIRDLGPWLHVMFDHFFKFH